MEASGLQFVVDRKDGLHEFGRVNEASAFDAGVNELLPLLVLLKNLKKCAKGSLQVRASGRGIFSSRSPGLEPATPGLVVLGT